MSKRDHLSPIKIIDSKVLGVEFKQFEEVDDEEEFNKVLITRYAPGRLFIENDHLRCEAVLEAVIRREHKNLDRSIFFTASCMVGMTTAVPLKALENISMEESEEMLRANGITFAYGKIRSIIESITAESEVGKQTIPPIRPYILLEPDE